MKSVKNGVKELFEDKEDVIFYPTYGYREGSDWKIPIRFWVHEPRTPAEELATLLAASFGKANDQEKRNLKARIADLVADSESGEEVIFKFDNDPDEEEWQVQSKTDLNGIIEGFVKLPNERASTLLQRQGSENLWLTFRAISKDHSGVGRARLIEREGLSVVSDIDDTIKITEIPAGGKVVVRNTFFRDFAAAPGMANRYRDLGEASFHYVSGGPWQLYAPLSDYIKENGFPEGSFHMKSVPKHLLSPKTWEDLFKLMGDATIVQKISQISEIMSRFPERKFILVGDSGEHDPEVYGQLRETFRNRIKEILIRDVVDARHISPDRLEGMTIIEALTVMKGVSQFQ
jgi:phosphatidate phosphatase APP1